ncbi:esterase/lipase family protein [Streptomyces pathocidini]|uniref:Esterase/lipase family protein n=1 Tax=Streptomyces pathocidini TaxID=1650571 RepID=A0ABW7UL10_9ACTN|nr:triacylglycerol lipase [Streptomyces pathocidini]
MRSRSVGLVAALLSAVTALALSAVSTAAAVARPAPAAVAHTPVVFVHGYNADPGVWGALREDFEADGYTDAELFSFRYDTSQSVNEKIAGELESYVEDVLAETGAEQVDLVGHSFGSLSIRWYAKFGAGKDTVDHLVSLAGPNHGTNWAWACAFWDQACRDMTPGSYVQKNLAEGDETPGDIAYATFWSDCDEMINPHTSVELDGATNTQTACLAHNDLLSDEAVSQRVRAFISG